MSTLYSPSGKVLWDSWFIKDNGVFHVFYLQCLPTKDSEKRHDNNVSIGHAISKDLIQWKEQKIALEPGINDAWDNLSLWTGSVIKKDDEYFMFYTGRNSKKDRNYVQKIGSSVSKDLYNWEKMKGNPMLEAKGYYSIDNNKNSLNNIGAWRDPFVFLDPASKKYYMTVTAREKGEKREYNGCVALLESNNLLDWKILPPMFSPGFYDEIECTQVIFHKGVYYLFISTHERNYKPDFAKKVGSCGGLHCYYSTRLFDGYKPVNENGVVLNNSEEMYSVSLLYDKQDEFYAIGWMNKSQDSSFVGKLTKPFKIKIDNDTALKS